MNFSTRGLYIYLILISFSQFSLTGNNCQEESLIALLTVQCINEQIYLHLNNSLWRSLSVVASVALWSQSSDRSNVVWLLTVLLLFEKIFFFFFFGFVKKLLSLSSIQDLFTRISISGYVRVFSGRVNLATLVRNCFFSI